MPRFVILWHEAGPALGRPSHFDLLFEDQCDARAWYVEQRPALDCDLTARELPRHRLHFFEYEGPLSGDRGRVSRWDQGEYNLLVATAVEFEAKLEGKALRGILKLSRVDLAEWRLRLQKTP